MSQDSNSIKSVKGSISSMGWKAEYATQLEDYVCKVNTLTTYSYLFARYIFLNELENPGFDISILVEKKFFYEIFLTLTIQKNVKRERSNKTMRFRALIQRHRHSFLSAARLEPINFTYAQQPATYEAHTAYINNTKVHFGKLLRRIINELLGVKNSAKTLREQLINQGLDPVYINVVHNNNYSLYQ